MNMHACRMRELTADGKADPAELLKDAGFHVGSFVRRKQDRAEAKIVSIERALVNLQIQPDGRGPLPCNLSWTVSGLCLCHVKHPK